MAKINLSNVSTLTGINSNIQQIEDQLNQKVLYRNNPVGEPNTMESSLDMNGERIVNLPAPVNLNEPARLSDIQDIITGDIFVGPDAGSLTGSEEVPIKRGTGVLKTTLTKIYEFVQSFFANTADVAKGDALIGVQSTVAGSVARTQHDKNAERYTVQDAGALVGGLIDATAAFNAAFAEVRSKQSGTLLSEGTTSAILEIPPGYYLVNGSINVTGITAVNLVIEGNGAVIVGKCVGKPVMDFLGSCNYTINNLTVLGDSVSVPSYGILRGRASNANAGKVSMSKVVVDGHFTRAAYYNLAGEVDTYFKCRFTNRRADPASYTMIEDGGNYENITSEFITQTNPVGVELSFNEQLHLSTEFRHFGNGVPILILGNQERHNYVNCYARTDGGSHIVETRYSNRVRDLWMDMHVEASTVARYLVVDNVNPTGSITFSGLKMTDHQPFTTDCLIDLTGATQNVLFDCMELDIGDPFNSIPIFGDGAGAGVIKALCEGSIKWASSKTLDLSNCAFNGLIFTKDTNAITHTFGAYSIIRRAATGARFIETKGYGRFSGTGEGTTADNYVEVRGAAAGAGVNVVAGGTDTNVSLSMTAKGTGTVALQANGGIGLLVVPPATTPANYARLAPSVAGTGVELSAQGTDTDIDMRIQAKGSGRVRFGAHTANADAPITGYIEIKDAGGTTRKLAVIT